MTDCRTLLLLAPTEPQPAVLARFAEANRARLARHGWRCRPGPRAAGDPALPASAGDLLVEGLEALLLVGPRDGEVAGAAAVRVVLAVGSGAGLRPRHQRVRREAVRALGEGCVTVLPAPYARPAALPEAVEDVLGLPAGSLRPAPPLRRGLTEQELALVRLVTGQVRAEPGDPEEGLRLLDQGTVPHLQGLAPPSRSDHPTAVPLAAAVGAALGVLEPLAREALAAGASTDDDAVHEERVLRLQAARAEAKRLRAALAAEPSADRVSSRTLWTLAARRLVPRRGSRKSAAGGPR